MRLFKNSTITLTIYFCMLFANNSNAKVLWEKELILDTNTNSAPLASCLNKDANGIIVMTRECPKGKFPVLGGDLALWEIGTDGNVNRTMPKDANGNRIWTNTHSTGVGPGCAMVNDNNLLTIGVLNGQSGKNEQKIAIVSKTDKTEKMMSSRNSIENYSIIKMMPLRDNTFVLVGQRNSNGLCMRIDNQGTIIQERLFDTNQTNVMSIFSGVDQIKSNLAVVGISANLSMNDYHKNYAESFILIYDPNLNLVREDHFANENSVSMFSLSPHPKVCSLNNGNIAVLYKKESADPNKTLLWTRCYTQQLKLLWDKEIFIADKRPFAMDITVRESGGFTVGIIQYFVQQSNSLELDSFNNEGNKIDSYNTKGIIGMGGFNLMHLNNKVIAVFEEGTAGNIRECTIKAKVIALD